MGQQNQNNGNNNSTTNSQQQKQAEDRESTISKVMGKLEDEKYRQDEATPYATRNGSSKEGQKPKPRYSQDSITEEESVPPADAPVRKEKMGFTLYASTDVDQSSLFKSASPLNTPNLTGISSGLPLGVPKGKG